MLKCKGRLASFLHSILSGSPLLCDEGTSPRPLWPLPLPYPEVFRSGSQSGAGWKKRRVCLQLVVLNWLFLGQPDVAPRSLKLGLKLMPAQWKVVRLLEDLAEDDNSVQKVDACGMGRSASKTESQDDELGALHRALWQVQESAPFYGRRNFSPAARVERDEEFPLSSHVVGKLPGKPFVTAKPLESERLQFGAAPRFDPLPFLDSKTAAMYMEPSLFHKEEHEAPPVVSIRASPSEKLRLFGKMAECGRLKLLTEDEVEERYASGLFAVVKDLERDRLIMDSRPANVREKGLNHWCGCLASAALLGQIVLLPEEDLNMSGEDLKDFCYQVVVGPSRAARNCLVLRLSSA